jgi:uncharacterized iron-regulated membrane protein
MKTRVLLRKIHHWGSLLIMVQLGLVIISGLVLMLKKELDWIQPPTQQGIETSAVPAQSLAAMFDTVRGVPQMQVSTWADLDRVDFKPGKGVVKFVAKNDWETQIDTASGQILQISLRRSDWIEALHDGSFFADWVKLYVFLPAGVGLLILWVTGIYLFFLPHWKRARRRAMRRAARAFDASPKAGMVARKQDKHLKSGGFP